MFISAFPALEGSGASDNRWTGYCVSQKSGLVEMLVNHLEGGDLRDCERKTDSVDLKILFNCLPERNLLVKANQAWAASATCRWCSMI